MSSTPQEINSDETQRGSRPPSVLKSQLSLFPRRSIDNQNLLCELEIDNQNLLCEPENKEREFHSLIDWARTEIFIIDDKAHRTNEIEHLLNETLDDLSINLKPKIHTFVNRTEALKKMKELQDASAVVISDIYTHTDMDAVEFAEEVRKTVKAFIIMYSARIKKVLENMPDLDPQTQSGLTDVLLDKHDMRKALNKALGFYYGLEGYENDGDDIFPVYYDEVVRGDEEGDQEVVASKHITTPESGLLKIVNTWVDDINSGGKLGKRWPLVTGGERGAQIRLNKERWLLDHVVQEQMLRLSGKPPGILLTGLGSYAIEAIYLARRYPNSKITAIELDPILRAQAEKSIKLAGLEGRINIISCEWQNMPNELPEPFDIVISLGNELDCLPSDDDKLIVVNNIHEVTNPNGLFVCYQRNSYEVIRGHNIIRHNGLNKFVNEKGNMGYPMYNSAKNYRDRVISYPLAILKEEGRTDRVQFNYMYADPMMQEQEGDAPLTMLLPELQDSYDIQNEIGFKIVEAYADFNLKDGVGNLNRSITNVSKNLKLSKANFYQTVSRKVS